MALVLSRLLAPFALFLAATALQWSATTPQLAHFADIADCELLRTGTGLNKAAPHDDVLVQKRKARLHEHDSGEIKRFWSLDHDRLWDALHTECPSLRQQPVGVVAQVPLVSESRNAPPLVITPILASGDSGNRVNMVFFGDGYTEEEYDKFIDDSSKLAWDIAGDDTFATVRPLLNVFAAFTPSKESGIGIGGKPKDTVYGLYRDGTELRGVYPYNFHIARLACDSAAKSVGCDYPILLGNDPRYGGLGGEFTIVTSSLLNGPTVLRHELGHSVIEVGEEYDGGFAYFGVNAAHSLGKGSTEQSQEDDTFKWSHWLTNKDQLREERAVMPLQDYAWTMLNKSAPWTTSFTSAGTYDSFAVSFSLSGIPRKSHLRVSLDGKDLGWVPRKSVGEDRWHYRIESKKALAEGEHEIEFALLDDGVEGDRTTGQGAQLCSVEVVEYGNAEEFNTEEGYIGAYPTFSERNQTSYRPTNEGCLMRMVTTPNFCKVCIEGLWQSLLRRIDLIDSIDVSMESCDDPLVVDVKLLGLAQFRTPTQMHLAERHHEQYLVTWIKDGEVVEPLANQTRIVVAPREASGVYEVDVRFITDEVRRDPEHVFRAGRTVLVDTSC